MLAQGSSKIMKRSLSEVTIDWGDQDAMDLEHNRQILLQIENLKKQLKIKNHTTERIPINTLKADMIKKMPEEIHERFPQYHTFNIAQYTIFKHDVLSTGNGEVYKRIWQFVDDGGVGCGLDSLKAHIEYQKKRISKTMLILEDIDENIEYVEENNTKELIELAIRTLDGDISDSDSDDETSDDST